MHHSKIYLVWKKVSTNYGGTIDQTKVVLGAFTSSAEAIRHINRAFKLRIGMLRKEYDGQFIASGGDLDFVIDSVVSTSKVVSIRNIIVNEEVISYRYYMTDTLLYQSDDL